MSEYVWPRAATPSTADWNTWDLALSMVFQAGHNLKLPHPLGKYLQPGNSSWYFDQLEKALWFASKKEWKRHGYIPSRSCTIAFHNQGQVAIPTNPLQHATVQVQASKIILTGSGMIETHGPPLEGTPFLQQHPFCHEWHWELTVVSDLQEVVADICIGKGYMVSDNSFQEKRALQLGL